MPHQDSSCEHKVPQTFQGVPKTDGKNGDCLQSVRSARFQQVCQYTRSVSIHSKCLSFGQLSNPGNAETPDKYCTLDWRLLLCCRKVHVYMGRKLLSLSLYKVQHNASKHSSIPVSTMLNCSGCSNSVDLKIQTIQRKVMNLIQNILWVKLGHVKSKFCAYKSKMSLFFP